MPARTAAQSRTMPWQKSDQLLAARAIHGSRSSWRSCEAWPESCHQIATSVSIGTPFNRRDHHHIGLGQLIASNRHRRSANGGRRVFICLTVRRFAACSGLPDAHFLAPGRHLKLIWWTVIGLFRGRSPDPWRTPQARHRANLGRQYWQGIENPPKGGDIPSQPHRWITSMDLFVVPTLSFRLLYGLLILYHGTVKSYGWQ